MGQKKITDLQLIDAVIDTLNVPADDTIQSYRFTAAQFWTYLKKKMSTSRVIDAAGEDITEDDVIVQLDPTAAPFTQNLPALSSMPDEFMVCFKNIATNGNAVTIDASGSEEIDVTTTLVLNTMDSVWLLRSNSRWLLL